MSRRGISLDPEQLLAATTPGSLALTAGAGTGKTEVLAHRFVGLLTGALGPPLTPDRMAAITFTEKATDDMKRRIAEVLDDYLMAAPASDERIHLERCRRMLPLARISTLHGFCARILRENPLEAGLDPGFTVMDEFASSTYLKTAVKEMLLDALRRDDPGAVYLIGVLGLTGSDRREGAVEVVALLLEGLERKGCSIEAFMTATRRHCEAVRNRAGEVAASAQRLAAIIDEMIIAGQRGNQASVGAVEGLGAQWPRLRHQLLKFSAESRPEALDPLSELAALMPKAQAKAIKDKVEEAKKLLAKDKRLGASGELIEQWGGQRAIEPTLLVGRLTADLGTRIAERKRTEGALTYGDLLERACSLLERQPAVALRYRTQLGAILVDEFQDTDPIQGRVIRALTDHSSAGPAPQLFIVGDEKQSIYRFRGADVSVFKRMRHGLPRQMGLTLNRRSVAPVVEFVNRLGERMMSGSEARPDYAIRWDSALSLKPHRASRPEAAIELLAVPLVEEQRLSELRRVEEANLIAARVLELVGSAPVIDPVTGAERLTRFGDITILLRSFSDVATYERGLRERSVPSYTVRGRGFFQCQEVADLANLIAAVDDPRDYLALVAALRSPLFSLSDQTLLEMALAGGRRRLAGFFGSDAPPFERLGEQAEDARDAWAKLTELRAMRDRAELPQILERALELTDLEAVLLAGPGRVQKAANVRKLLEIARGFSSWPLFTLADFAAHLRRLVAEATVEPEMQVADETDDVVRLMTVHQAKGMEFPVVVLADLGRKPPSMRHNYLLGEDGRLLMRAVVGAGFEELPNPGTNRQAELEKDQDLAESARLLYVAVTRARDRLVLCEAGGEGPWRKWVREMLGPKVIDEFIHSSIDNRVLELEGLAVALRKPGVDAAAQGELPARQGEGEPADEQHTVMRQRLNFRPEAPRGLTLSPTLVETFARCPRQYLLRHELQAPDGGGIAARKGLEDGAAEKGLAIHAALELLELTTRGAALARQVRERLSAIDLPPPVREELARDLVRYVEQLDPSEQVVGREIPFLLPLRGGSLVLFIRGQIDLLARHGSGLVVRDYKYTWPSEPQSRAYRIQMACYMLAVGRNYPGSEIRGELVYLRGGAATIAVPTQAPGEVEEELLALGARLIEARREGRYPKFPSGPAECRTMGCGYVALCWH